jgi:hypothetical protein
MSHPVIFVIDGDAGVTAALREDLDRRFGEDFRVLGESSADSGWPRCARWPAPASR